MPRITEFSLLEQEARSAMSVRTRTTMAEIPATIGPGFSRLGAYFESQGALLADVPFICYHNEDMDDLDMELVFPVARLLPQSGDIRQAPIPSRKVATFLFLGSYQDIGPVYGELMEWIAAQGYRPTGQTCETYYNDPTYPPEQCLTQVAMVVEQA